MACQHLRLDRYFGNNVNVVISLQINQINQFQNLSSPAMFLITWKVSENIKGWKSQAIFNWRIDCLFFFRNLHASFRLWQRICVLGTLTSCAVASKSIAMRRGRWVLVSMRESSSVSSPKAWTSCPCRACEDCPSSSDSWRCTRERWLCAQHD